MEPIYLSELSERDKPWDIRRWQSELVASLYRGSKYNKYAYRITDCSRLLDFILRPDLTTGDLALKLYAARFCRVRHCPICQWRKSLMWYARFFKAIPLVLQEHPAYRFIFLTLTIRNCDLIDLRQTVKDMASGWKKLVALKDFPAVGFVRSLEVTRSREDQAHPHYHCMLMVPPSYFKGGEYLGQAHWTELWQRSLKVDYVPVVNVKAVKPRPDLGLDGLSSHVDALRKTILETLKYSVKPGDLIGGVVLDQDKNLVLNHQANVKNSQWLCELTNQLHSVQSISVGGILRKFVSEKDPEDLIHSEDEDPFEGLSEDELQHLFFGWRDIPKRYAQNT